MIEKFEQENQEELFPEFSSEPPKKTGHLSFLSKNPRPILITTHPEQLILAGIILILAGCFIFFLGVLRGRSQDTPIVRPPNLSVTQPTSFQKQKSLSPAQVQNAVLPVSRTISADLNKPYSIQLCTYKSQTLAEKEVALLRKKGYYSFIIPSDNYYQVCAGQYISKEHAKKDLKVFGSIYKGCFLRRR